MLPIVIPPLIEHIPSNFANKQEIHLLATIKIKINKYNEVVSQSTYLLMWLLITLPLTLNLPLMYTNSKLHCVYVELHKDGMY